MEDLKSKGHAYVSYKFRDNQYYKSTFRKEVNFSGKNDFVHDIRPKKDLKFASPRTVAETMLKIDPNVDDDRFRYYIANPYGTNSEYVSKSYKRKQKELFSRLKDMGYDGMVDYTDQSRRKGAQPLIIFDPDQVADVKSSHKIGKFEEFIASKLE